jgi:tRNA A-37 threonylcarbamoyl transferase component Bud32
MEVVRLLGRGGTGVVELVREDDGRLVARKRIPLHGTAGDIDRARARIRREADILRRLEHPGIVRLLRADTVGDDLVLVMPYLPGGTLQERINSYGALPPRDVAHLGQHLAGALAAAHAAGVVHRDVKPANVLFDDSGRPALADFGVALSKDATLVLTRESAVVGTPGFVAPEVARGEAASPASDVFSLGATLLYALTGLPPYGGGDPVLQIVRAARGETPVLPPGLPDELAARLGRMLSPDPARRPSAARAFEGETPTVDDPPAVTAPASRRARRRAPMVAALAVALVAVIAGTGVWWANRPAASSVRGPDTAAGTATSTPGCTPLRYRPCGQPAAPFTDGERCIEDHADYDGKRPNGCEAAPDLVDGQPVVGRLEANLVPASDQDRYPLEVTDEFQLICGGRLEIVLTSPKGVAQRLEVLSGDEVLGVAASADGLPAEVELTEPSCGSDDSATLTLRVSTVSGHSAEPYVLESSGSW